GSKGSVLDVFLSARLPGILPGILAGLATLAAVGAFGYSGRVVLGAMAKYRAPRNSITTPRGTSANQQTVHEARISFWGYPAVNASLSLVLGCFPFIVGGTVTAASAVATGTGQQINLGLWHGF